MKYQSITELETNARSQPSVWLQKSAPSSAKSAGQLFAYVSTSSVSEPSAEKQHRSKNNKRRARSSAERVGRSKAKARVPREAGEAMDEPRSNAAGTEDCKRVAAEQSNEDQGGAPKGGKGQRRLERKGGALEAAPIEGPKPRCQVKIAR